MRGLNGCLPFQYHASDRDSWRSRCPQYFPLALKHGIYRDFKSERTEGVIPGELILDKCALRPEEFTGKRWIDLADLKPCIIPVAQGEPKIGPDSMSDDIGWKSVAGIGDGLHGRNSKVAPAAKLPINLMTLGRFWRNDATN